MRRTLPLSVLTVAVLAGCASTDLKPITKPVNARIIERDLVPPTPAVRHPPARLSGTDATKAQADETAGLPIMPLRSRGVPAAGKAAEQGDDKSLALAGKAAASAPLATDVSKSAAAPAKAVTIDSEKAAKGQLWQIKASDVRLAVTFERWAKESTDRGVPYSVLWDAGKHVLIEAPTEFRGTFLDAVEQALKSPSILQSDYPLEACEYPNKPPVVRITRWGEQAKDCPEYR